MTTDELATTSSPDGGSPDGPRCARPGCTTARPTGATARWRFCSVACKQAAYRVRRREKEQADGDQGAVAVLDQELQSAAHRLLQELQHTIERMEGCDVPRSALTAGMLDLARGLTEAAVARDRAAGLPWTAIGTCLDIRDDAVRRSFGIPAAERLASARDTPE